MRAAPLYVQGYEVLKADILSGEFPPGEELTDEVVAAHLGISRSPAREAIAKCVQDGLLRKDGRGRLTVFSPTAVDFAELYACRAELESLAARILCLSQGLAAAADELTAIAQQAWEAAQGDHPDRGRVGELNARFHQTLVVRSGAENVREVLEKIGSKITICRMVSRSHGDELPASQDHRVIADVLRSGDAEAAAKAVRVHILLAAKRNVERLIEEGRGPADAPIVRYLLQLSR